MAQNDRQGGSENQQMTLSGRLTFVLNALKHRREEIEAILPVDLNFDQFFATINQALRNNPGLLQATGASIVNACIKAAYDGLRIDGREAALVTHNVKISIKGQQDRWEIQAQYFPMVFGLIQQVLRGGEVIAMDAAVIHEFDDYHVQRGTNPQIHHEPRMVGDRGQPIAAYSIATYKGGHVGFEVMTEAQIILVRAASKTGMKDGKPAGIWLKWWEAMWKKTVIRQHRKILPLGNRDFYDAEAREEFPEHQPREALSAPPPKPTRQQAAIADHSGDNGVPLDMGASFEAGDDDRGELVEGTSADKPAAANKRRAAEAKKEPAKADAKASTAAELPEDNAAWAAWSTDLERQIIAARSAPELHLLAEDEAKRIAAAGERGDFIKSLISDRITELVIDAASGSATGGED